MKWLGRLDRKVVRLAVVTATLTVVSVVLVAVLSPDSVEDRPAI